MTATILLSDVEVESRTAIEKVLVSRLGFEVLPVGGAPFIADALTQTVPSPIEAILLDVSSHHADTLTIIQRLRQRHPSLPIIALTNYGDMKQASAALKAGAMDYLSRPVSHQRLQVCLQNAIRQHRMAEEITRLQQRQSHYSNAGFDFPEGTYLHDLTITPHSLESPLVIWGEEGTGKEQIAQRLHHLSPVQERAFVPFTCHKLQGVALESLAAEDSANPLGNALKHVQGGTLFLKHLDQLVPDYQAAVLNYCQSHLQQEQLIISLREAPEGLWAQQRIAESIYRLAQGNALEIRPMRDCRDDIAALAHDYTESYALQHNPLVTGISDLAVELMQHYNWPGNLRELERVIFRSVMAAESSQVEVEDILPYLPAGSLSDYTEIDPQEAIVRSGRMPLTNQEGELRRLRDLEADMIQFAIRFYEGRISEVARKLGIGRSTLYRKLHDLDIEVA